MKQKHAKTLNVTSSITPNFNNNNMALANGTVNIINSMRTKKPSISLQFT